MISVAMIGHGAIGGWVARQFDDDDTVKISHVLCRPGRESAAEEVIRGAGAITHTDQLDEKVDYVVECAGHAALINHGPEILLRGIDLGIVSTGAFADELVSSQLMAAASQAGSHIDLLSGAIGALDALSAAKQGGLATVQYIGRKPPAGWIGSVAEEVIDLDNVENPTVHFAGNARDAARKYPKNANVAASVALAGIGLDKTEVTLIADPKITKNQHEVRAEGRFGDFTFMIEGNTLPNNPKTSALTAMAVVKAIRNRASTIRL